MHHDFYHQYCFRTFIHSLGELWKRGFDPSTGGGTTLKHVFHETQDDKHGQSYLGFWIRGNLRKPCILTVKGRNVRHTYRNKRVGSQFPELVGHNEIE